MPTSTNILDTTDINPTSSNIEVDDEDTVKQPIIVFDTRSADELLSEAKALLLEKNGDYSQVIIDLKSIISTQPIEAAREAHELLGYVYEKNKMLNKAMSQYNRYLALYPDDNEDRTRVRQRLMSLEILNPRETLIGKIEENKTKTPRQGDNTQFSGNISEYVYFSSSKLGTELFEWNNNQINSLTGVQLSFSQQHNQYTLSSRIRFTEVKDFSSHKGNKTNLSNAYIDFEDTYKGWNIRLGRQQPVAGAVGKFDGISSKIQLNENTKLSLSVGEPYTGAHSNNNKRVFQGAEIDYTLNSNWAIGGYLNRETVGGLLERFAIGVDLDYRDNGTSCLLRTEYDTVYNSLNAVSLQFFKYVGKYDVFALIERRKSPMPYADVALGLGLLSPEKQVYNSVSDLLIKSGLSNSEIYSYISNSTPVATSAVVGVGKQINKTWNATVNAQISNLSTVPGYTINPQFDPIPIQVGQDKTYALNLHLRGENLIVKDNTTEVVINKSTGATNSTSLTLADNYKLDKNKDSLSVILRVDSYDQNSLKGHNLSAILRGFYNLNDHLVLEGQYSRALVMPPYNQKLTDSKSQMTTDQSFYLGFRYDF